LDCDDDGIGNSQVYDDDEHPGIMCFSDLLKTHAIDLVHQEDSRDSQISHAERRCVSAEMDVTPGTRKSKGFTGKPAEAAKATQKEPKQQSTCTGMPWARPSA
jgi:hypothetical protein